MELLTAWGKRRLSPAYVPHFGAKGKVGVPMHGAQGASGVWRDGGVPMRFFGGWSKVKRHVCRIER
jgi:hypothetical protein